MTILFLGGEMGAFVPSGGGVSESTTADFNPSFARCAIKLDAGTSDPDVLYAETSAWTAATGDFFLHFEEHPGNVDAVAAIDVVHLLNAAGTSVFRITQSRVSSTSRTWQVQYLNASSAWANAGSALTFDVNRTAYDLYVDLTGSIRLYSAGTEVLTVTGLSLGHISGIAKARFFSTGVGRSVSQVIAADESTIGMRLATIYPSGAGATTDWTGTYTEIDEIAYSDADFVNSSTNGQIELVTGTAPALTGYVVRAVGISARAKRGSSGPANLRLILRSGGTNYDNGADIALGLGYGAYEAIWETNPATSAAWVNTAISALQYGVKAIT